MKKLKEILTNAAYGMLRAYEGKRFWPSLILKLVMALASAVITAFFADTLFSKNNTANQIFAALFFYFLILSVSRLIGEVRRGGFGKRVKTVICNMVRLKPPALWFFLAVAAISLFLPYAFVLALGILLFASAASGENSMLLSIKNAVTKGKNPEQNGRGLAAFTSGLIACGLVVCILANLGLPTLYGVMDGGLKNGGAQSDYTEAEDYVNSTTPSAAGDASVGAASGSGGGEVAASGDLDITEAAQILTDKLIEYAGSDRKSFEKLFRGTDSAAMDQYYNTSYDTFKEYGKSLIAIAAEEGDYVWFTALYYRIPAGYPAEKEPAVYLSTIMSRGSDGWKLEWNDSARARLQSAYDEAGFSYYGREAMEQGYAWAKFFVPFDLNNAMLFYDGAVLCKVTEMYMDENDNLQITLYTSNDTGENIGLNGVDIAVTDGGQQLFSKHFDMDLLVEERNVSIYTLTIPSEELDFTSWSSPKISGFSFSYEEVW